MEEASAKGNLRLLVDEKTNDPGRLLKLMQGGGRRASAALFDSYGSDIDRIVWRLLGADSEHQDVVHDALCEVLRQVWRVREPASLKRWIHTVTACVVRKELRSRGYRRRFWGSEANPDRFEAAGADPESRQLLARTYSVLGRMPADERLAFSLRYIERFSSEEMAQALGCSQRTARRKLAKAKKRFRSLARRDSQLSGLLEAADEGEGER